jgi:hypothetical protein
MHSMSLNKLSVFMQLLSMETRHYTKKEYFSKHKILSTIYLLQEQRLNHNK